MYDTDKLLARAQVGLAFLVTVGFLAVLSVLLLRGAMLSQTATTILTGLLSVLGTILTLIMNYFFARHRPQKPDGDGATVPSPTSSPSTPGATP